MILTIGHSTHAIGEFIAMLQAHGVEQLADVRTIPKSRHNPQFNADSLDAALAERGIAYQHMPGLGGLRHARKDSINTAWKNASYRGYADYMQTPEFEASLGDLVEWSEQKRTAIMCAESVPWRCHRSLIADAFVARGLEVEHIMTAAKRNPHSMTPFAKVEGERVTYPGLI